MNCGMTDEELMIKIERAVSKKTAHKSSKKRKKKKESAEELFKRLMMEDLVKKGYIKNF